MDENVFGLALRRFRRLNGIKQTHLAEELSVSQGTLSRWESGAQKPDSGLRLRAENMMRASARSGSDAALRRLITSSRSRVHLICDVTHRLLAVSHARERSWKTDAQHLLGTSLWRFASEEIIAAEQSLGDRGWFDRAFQAFEFFTGPNEGKALVITPGLMLWETIILEDGRVGRLTTAV